MAESSEIGQMRERRSASDRSHDASMEKNVQVKEEEIDPEQSGSVHWQPGVLARFPWMGLVAILAVIFSIVMAIVILSTCDNKLKEDWPTQFKVTWSLVKNNLKQEWIAKVESSTFKPSVALALCNTVTNLALGIAIAQGIAIGWWRRALHGTTVADLHQSWAYSTSVMDLLKAGRKFNLIALAALTAKISLVDSILLQQAVKTVPAYQHTDVRFPFASRTDLPWNYGGQYDANLMALYNASGTGFISEQFSLDLQDYSSDAKFISLREEAIASCHGSCLMQIPGFGFRLTCGDEVHLQNVSINPAKVMKATTAEAKLAALTNDTDNDSFVPNLINTGFAKFSANETQDFNGTDHKWGHSGIMITTGWSNVVPAKAGDENATECTVATTAQVCVLEPAKVNYTVYISNNVDEHGRAKSGGDRLGALLFDESPDRVEIDDGALYRSSIKIVGSFVDTAADTYSNLTTAMTEAFSTFFSINIGLEYLNNTGFVVRPTTQNAVSSSASSWWAGSHYPRSNMSSCVMNTVNPMTYILQEINSITFRMSINAGLTLEDSTKVNVEGEQWKESVMYVADKRFLWAAVAVMLTCLACTLPNYWGFWELGRKVTFSPMEVASAFQAPVLQHPVVAGGGEVNILLKEVGDKKVAYGQVEGARLAVAEEADVHKIYKTNTA